MRISLFLNNDLESNIALNCLLPELQKHSFNIYLSERVGPSTYSSKALQYLDFLEREFLQRFLFPKLEAKSYLGFLTFGQIASQHHADLTHVNSLVSEEILTKISAFQPDLFISIRFGKIFKGAILQIPPLGIINLHSAILPDYKGVLGTVRAFIDGQQQIGSTIHYITNSEIDAGDILGINLLEVHPEKSVLWHILHLYPQAAETLSHMINQLSTGEEIKGSPQRKGGNYYSFPTERDFTILTQKGIVLFMLDEYAEFITEFYGIERSLLANQLALSELPNSF